MTLFHGSEPTLPGAEAQSGWRFPPGAVLDGIYEIRSLLGQGGMGQVFEAHDRILNRRVAIKVAWPGECEAALRKESTALAALRHPGLVTVHAFGAHEGVEYIVLERIYGVSLAAHIDRREQSRERFTAEETIELLSSLAEVLEVVHDACIVHRDVKPANVMLAPRNRLVLMDLGLFLPEYEIAPLQSTLTGTPHYMAPETIVGTMRRGAGHLVDLYALGVIGFELLTGRFPFDGADPHAILSSRLHGDAPPIRSLRADVPPSLAALVDALLARDPDSRPQSARELSTALGRIELPSAPRPSAFTVLIVDDHPETAELLRVSIGRVLPEATLLTAYNGLQALEAVRRHKPNAITVDLEMAGMNGLELCLYLRGLETSDDCALFVVIGKAMPADVQLLRALGVEDVIPKAPGFWNRVSSQFSRLQLRRGAIR